MSSCGVNIPLDELVEVIITKYADVFAREVITRMRLSDYVKVSSGEASSLTLRNSLTIDNAVKADLCSALQDCIAVKVKAELGCERDNHVIGLSIDKDKDHLVIELKFGERYYISRAELESWLTIAAGGIQSGTLTTSPNQTIRITNKDGSTVDIDVSALADIKIDGGEIVNGELIRLHRSDGKSIDINASTLVPNSPYVVSGVFIDRDNGYWLDFTRSDDTKVNVDMTSIISAISNAVFDKVIGTGYRINTQSVDYVTSGDDFNGHTIIRADKNGNQTINLTRPPNEDFVGKSIVVRKTNGDAGTFVTLSTSSGVSIVPEDITPIRRIGSSVTLVYIGNGVYDAFGELP